MLPGNTDFVADPFSLAFLGVFAAVLLTVASTLVYAFVATRRAIARGKASAMLWHEEFEELPASAKECRHSITGELPGRRCARAFDCKGCEKHAELLSVAPSSSSSDASGLDVPNDRLYHRGHAWLKPLEDGTVAVGLDDLASRLVGPYPALELPPVGARVEENGPALRLRAGRARVRVASPVTGDVVEHGSLEAPFVLRVKPTLPLDTRALLTPREAAAYLARELDRLQLAISGARGVPALADGGLPVADLSSAIPAEDRDRVLGEMLLES
jgi:glycine cleavage system H protein